MERNLILLVDDDEDDQLIFRDALTEVSNDLQCIAAGNGQEAFELLDEQEYLPGIVFLDLNMPFMNGFEFLKRFKQDPRFKQIPVIIYTTSDNPTDAKNTLDAGADLFFTKTSDYRLLKLKLHKILAEEVKKW